MTHKLYGDNAVILVILVWSILVFLQWWNCLGLSCAHSFIWHPSTFSLWLQQFFIYLSLSTSTCLMWWEYWRITSQRHTLTLHHHQTSRRNFLPTQNVKERGDFVLCCWTQCVFVIPAMILWFILVCVFLCTAGSQNLHNITAGSYQANELDLELALWEFCSPAIHQCWYSPSHVERKKSLYPLSAFPAVWSAVFVPHANVCDSQHRPVGS